MTSNCTNSQRGEAKILFRNEHKFQSFRKGSGCKSKVGFTVWQRAEYLDCWSSVPCAVWQTSCLWFNAGSCHLCWLLSLLTSNQFNTSVNISSFCCYYWTPKLAARFRPQHFEWKLSVSDRKMAVKSKTSYSLKPPFPLIYMHISPESSSLRYNVPEHWESNENKN